MFRNLPVYPWHFQAMCILPRAALRKLRSKLTKVLSTSLSSEVNGSTLVLKTKDGHWRDLGKIKAYITMPDVSELTVIGIG